MSPIWQHPGTVKKQVMPGALLYAWCSPQGTAQELVLLLTNLPTSGIIWAFRIWITLRICDKEKLSLFYKENFRHSSVPTYDSNRYLHAGCLHMCSISHQGVLLEELSHLSLLNCTSVCILEGSLLQD